MNTKLSTTLEKIKHIGNSAKVAFIDRDEFVTALELATVSGLHMIVLGPPGTGKSAGVRYFAQAMGVKFFRKLLNPDLPREDLVGPLDPVKLQQGTWDRKWLGIATSPVVFIDEIGKASAQVMNMLLDAMEERKASCADNDIDIPLHTLISASNETIATESPAMWNRFSLRVLVERISRTADFERFLKDSWQVDHPPTVPISEDELIALRKKCGEMASVAWKSTKLKRVLIKAFVEMENVASVIPTPRQWKNVLLAAAANALLNDREQIISADLWVAGMMLWDDIDEIDNIKAFFNELIKQEDRELKAAQEVYERMTEALNTTEGNNFESLGRLSFRAKKLLSQVSEKIEETKEQEWKVLAVGLVDLIKKIEEKGTSASEPVF